MLYVQMKLFHKITALLLTALILIGTTGFTIEKFYCGSYLKSIHLFTSPTPCCLKPNNPEGKCRTETEYITSKFNGDLPFLTQKIEQLTNFPATSTLFFQFLFTYSKSYPVMYLNYKPPLLVKDIPVHIQSFLI